VFFNLQVDYVVERGFDTGKQVPVQVYGYRATLTRLCRKTPLAPAYGDNKMHLTPFI